jgi:hypothetical protein
MLFYFGMRYYATKVGGQDIRVVCDKCGCEYFYELTRAGSGSEVAPYLLGTGHAKRTAVAQSERELQQRLASEAELVSCPACNWINDRLVEGYRLGRFRGFKTAAVWVGVIGTSISLICAWFISIGPPKDAWLVPYFLMGGPALSLVIAAGLILLRNWLRSRIRPNRDFPRMPKVPLATPPALFMEKSSEQLKIAKPDQLLVAATGGWQDFQLERHQFPPTCCNCLRPASREHALIIPVTDSTNLEIPQCAACAVRPGRVRGFLIFASICLFIGDMTYSLMWYDAGYSCLITCGLLVTLFVAVAVITSFVREPVDAIVVDRSRGVVRLRFRNAAYRSLVTHKRDR